MKKRFLPLTLLFPLLTACGATDYTGKYIFQLGKDKETHIGIYLELTNTLFDEAKPEKGNKYTLKIDMTTSEDTSSSVIALLNDFEMEGYYAVKPDSQIDGDTVLSIGIEFLGEFEIPSEITTYIFAATINEKQVNFIIPVSMDDLNYQLYWYGFDITYERIAEAEGKGETISPETFVNEDKKHEIGSHPTKEEIDAINETYPSEHDGKLFRDYHTLTMGLLKQ